MYMINIIHLRKSFHMVSYSVVGLFKLKLN